MPKYSLPNIFLGLMTSNSVHRASSRSETRSKGKECLALKFSWALRLSRDAPRILVEAAAKTSAASLKSHPSVVQPGVLAFG